jgi:hypothetical protein
VDVKTYEVAAEYATVDSTVVEEEREVLADSSSYDDGNGTAAAEEK